MPFRVFLFSFRCKLYCNGFSASKESSVKTLHPRDATHELILYSSKICRKNGKNNWRSRILDYEKTVGLSQLEPRKNDYSGRTEFFKFYPDLQNIFTRSGAWRLVVRTANWSLIKTFLIKTHTLFWKPFKTTINVIFLETILCFILLHIHVYVLSLNNLFHTQQIHKCIDLIY